MNTIREPIAVRGFTLIEVLIALAIVAIGLTAALRASGVGHEAALESRTRLIAMWLAQNVVAERTARGDWPDPGRQAQNAELAGHTFLLREVVKTTPNPRFRRLEVTVSLAMRPERPLHQLVAYLVRPE